MPNVIVRNHVRDPQTGETYLRGTHKVDEVVAYSLLSNHPENVEELSTVATDSAVELAVASGLDLDDIEGTGADGKVTKQDVQRAVDSSSASGATEEPQA